FTRRHGCFQTSFQERSRQFFFPEDFGIAPELYFLFKRRKAAMIKMLMMVGLGSFAGGILRFLLSRFVQVNSASSFPWGTAAVNLLGCFILGALYGLFDRNLPHTETRLFLTAGLCGGFTTFSTLMNESFLLLKEGNFSAFFLYTLISFAGGLLAIGLGYLAAR
ncbi:MAG: fluoride efflux transporter CrcB, partial [Akkermansia muciniphila]